MSLLADLKTYADKNTASRKLGLTVFLAHKAEIQEALAKGYNAKIIWECLKDKGIVNFSYATFTAYIKKHIPDPKHNPSQPLSALSRDKESKSFKWNPTPDKDKLI